MARSEFFKKSANNAPMPAVATANPATQSQGWSPADSDIGTTTVAEANVRQTSPINRMAQTLHVDMTSSVEGATKCEKQISGVGNDECGRNRERGVQGMYLD